LEIDPVLWSPVFRDAVAVHVERPRVRGGGRHRLEAHLDQVGHFGEFFVVPRAEVRQRGAVGLRRLRRDDLDRGRLGRGEGGHGRTSWVKETIQSQSCTSPTYTTPPGRRSNTSDTERTSRTPTPRSASRRSGRRSVCITILAAPKTTSG